LINVFLFSTTAKRFTRILTIIPAAAFRCKDNVVSRAQKPRLIGKCNGMNFQEQNVNGGNNPQRID
jgi:hypothetical protein